MNIVGNLTQGKTPVPLFTPSITFDFHVSPTGFTGSRNRGFPSFEATRTVGGQTRFIVKSPEGSGFFAPFCLGLGSAEMNSSERVEFARRRAAMQFLWNALAATGVFLPVFFAVAPIEGLARGADLSGGFKAHFGFALYLYVAFVVPVILGSLVHTVFLLMIPATWPRPRQRVAAIALSPLLPATVLVIGGLSGSALLLERIMATAVATIAYGLLSRMKLGAGQDTDSTLLRKESHGMS